MRRESPPIFEVSHFLIHFGHKLRLLHRFDWPRPRKPDSQHHWIDFHPNHHFQQGYLRPIFMKIRY